jgi:hypothetical protein
MPFGWDFKMVSRETMSTALILKESN